MVDFNYEEKNCAQRGLHKKKYEQSDFNDCVLWLYGRNNQQNAHARHQL